MQFATMIPKLSLAHFKTWGAPKICDPGSVPVACIDIYTESQYLGVASDNRIHAYLRYAGLE
jgi:hypothetical protein